MRLSYRVDVRGQNPGRRKYASPGSSDPLFGQSSLPTMGVGVLSQEYSGFNLLLRLRVSGVIHLLPPHPRVFVVRKGKFVFVCIVQRD
jgi:hypothetical protein